MALREELLPLVIDFLFDNDDLLMFSNHDQIDIKHQMLCFGVVRRDRPRCLGYIENVIPRYTLDDFRSIFRVSRGMFEEILNLLGPQLTAKHPRGGGRTSIDEVKTVLVSLYYMGCQETVRKIAEKFELSEFSVLKARERFCAALLSRKEEFIKWPQVKEVLSVLIHHNLVTFEANKRGFVEYTASLRNVLLRARLPLYIYFGRTLYDSPGEFILEELVRHGQLSMSTVIQRVAERLNEVLQGSKRTPATVYSIRDTFENLTKTMFLQRCPDLAVSEPETTAKVPVFKQTEETDLYIVPKVDLSAAGQKRRRSSEGNEQPRKKHKSSNSDDDIYWQLNFDRFERHHRDQIIIKAVSRKINPMAGEIVRNLLRLSEVSSDVTACTTNPLSYNEIFQALPKDLGLSRQTVDQYLKILTEDSMDFIHKTGESGGGMYNINFKKAFSSLCQAHIESVIQERFGSKSLRIYRLLLLKKQAEQKQIEESAMVSSKEAKELLYTMFEENFISLTEIPRTPDHAPSRTFFLFSVSLNSVARMLLQRCYKTMLNLILKGNQETAENKRLLDKQQRMEAIIASLEQSGADEAQKEEIEEMITPAERIQIDRVKNNTKKLETGELQVDDTIQVLQNYIHYAHMQ